MAKPSIPRTCKACGAAFLTTPWCLKMGYGQYCSRQCTLAVNKGIESRLSKKIIVVTVNEAGCYCCLSHIGNSDGYPRLHRNGRFLNLSRIIYEDIHGAIPPGLVIRHTCDNPSCANPEHLIIGTHADNVADCVERGRTTMGVKNAAAKLTDSDVAAIQRDKTTKSKALGQRYGVHPATIRAIRRRSLWRHVNT